MSIWDRVRFFWKGSSEPDWRRILASVRVLALDEEEKFDVLRRTSLAELRRRYGLSNEDDGLAMLQATIDDGTFHTKQDLNVLGLLWGDLLVSASGARWVTAEWDGTRLPVIQVPETGILLFPIVMLEKRRARRETVNFAFFFTNTVECIATMRASRKYDL